MDSRTVKTLDLVLGIIFLILNGLCGCGLAAAGFLGSAILGMGAASAASAGDAGAAAVAGAAGVLVGILGISSLVAAAGCIGVIMQKKWGYSIIVVLSAIQLILAIMSMSLGALVGCLFGVYCLLRLMGKIGEAPES